MSYRIDISNTGGPGRIVYADRAEAVEVLRKYGVPFPTVVITAAEGQEFAEVEGHNGEWIVVENLD